MKQLKIIIVIDSITFIIMVLQYLYTLYAQCPFPEVWKRNMVLLVTSLYCSDLGLYSWRFNNIVHSLLFFQYNITLSYPKPSSYSVAKYSFLLHDLLFSMSSLPKSCYVATSSSLTPFPLISSYWYGPFVFIFENVHF